MSEVAFIYTLSDPRDGAIRYVGKTFDLSERYYGHTADKARTHKANWIRSLAADGMKPVIEVLEEFHDAPEQEWMEAEKFWIEYLRQLGFKLTNMDSGGKSGTRRSEVTKRQISAKLKGIKRTEEFKRKVSEIRRRHVNSPETRIKLKAAASKRSPDFYARIAAKNRNPSPETLAKMSAASTGRKRSAEAILRTAAANKGRTLSCEQKRKMRAGLTPESISRRWVTRRANLAAKKGLEASRV